MIESTDIAYTAGYIDGDGCFHLREQILKNRKTTKFSAKLIISSVNQEVLDWFKEKFQGTKRLVKRKYPIGHKPQYHFIFDNKNFKEIRKVICNQYLVEKRVEGAWFSEFISSRSNEDKRICINYLKKEKSKEGLVLPSHKQDFEKLRNSVHPKEEDFAYLAGFIDAECCLNIQRYLPKDKPNYVYKILLQCNNTKFPFFKWALERFGGQIHFIERKKSMKQRDQLTWRLSSKALYPILLKIHPFIKHKKPVCEELIKFYKTNVPLIGTISRNSKAFSDFYQPIIQERETIFHNIQLLNKKGV